MRRGRVAGRLQGVFARVPELAEQTDPVLRAFDRLLEDDALLQRVRADLARRYPQTTCHGRHSTPVEALLRLLVVQHLFHWSWRETERRVADSLVLRWANRLQPVTMHQLLDRVVLLARQAKRPGGTRTGRKLRLDGTVVPTTIHHPTDSSLLVDGVRVRHGLQTLHWLARRQGEEAAEAGAEVYPKLVVITERTVSQAQRVREALGAAVRQGTAGAHRLAEQLDHFVPLVRRIIAQARRRVLEGAQVPSAEKVVSLFEPHTRIIPCHKGGAAVEFGRLLVLDEVEGGIVTRFHLLGDQTAEQGELGPPLAHHPPTLVAGDRGTHHADNERLAQEAGVSHLVIPRSGRLTPAQREREWSRAWRRRYRFRVGIEGRISSLRRDYGLRRYPAHGAAGLERYVGWALIASNLRHIAQKLAA